MRVKLGQEDYYGLIIEDIYERDNKDAYDVPPKLLNALQKAQNDVEVAERDIVRHLAKTKQVPEDHHLVRGYDR